MRANLKSCNLLGKADERLNITTSMESVEREQPYPSIYNTALSPLHTGNIGDVTVNVT